MKRQRNHRAPVAAHRPTMRKQLQAEGIVVPRPREVSEYLRQHPDLAELVPALCAEARREFDEANEATELSLEVYRDPEVNDRYLTLYVRQRNSGADLLPRIHRVGEAHAKDLAGVSGNLLVTTDFRAPRNQDGI